MKKLRLAAVGAVGALAAGAGLIFPATAQAAPTYWQFQNARFGTCLTGGNTSNAFATSCVGSARQQWDWIGDGPDGYKELRNRETGLCLMTDNQSSVNAVWQSTCSASAGQWWYYNAATQRLFNNMGGVDEEFLRTSNIQDAVYSTDLGQEASSYYTWAGTHD
ncbi:RICIN domain-containing protein [Streptomyces sp. MBT65]|uniref:RICIN domain-containing protein n=1 Tax=Streptomyces sp. MBT65 TaxID=1488395 RepID=UPI00190AA719|nr:RICIN domain-containing protein [Streptomyces sp. MBT65]MBK3574035.1 RICIN domain-containing protein [Streptomyces sp. MBT65]